ncbi:MAG: hypothetical protein JXA44_08605 [Methanospirillaceae archaeon]|nr:hypothetical protein [Methanospirillaceae archaeon]
MFEWERGTKRSPFTDSELRALKKFNDLIHRTEKTDALTVTYGKIFTCSFVGIIQIGEKRIEILPKLYNPSLDNRIETLSKPEKEKLYRIARKNLFSLLSISGTIPTYRSKISQYGKEKDFYEFFISLFLSDLERIMGHSLYHQYISQNDELGHIKGKLNFQEQIRKLPSQFNTFSCSFDEFSIDNPLNRLIKAALQKIRTFSKSEENKKRAFTFSMLMDKITDEVIVPSHFSAFHFDRLSENLKGLVEFSLLILFGSTYSAQDGSFQYYALIFDMNLVFEKYVLTLLRRSLQEYTFDYQHDLHLASDYHPDIEYKRKKKRVIPDLVVRENGKPIAVIDTKYKPDLANGFISNADFYQMMAYSVANESDVALLLYPDIRHEAGGLEREHFVVLDKLETEEKMERNVLISARSIQLFDDKGRIRRRLAERDIKSLRSVISRYMCLHGNSALHDGPE